MITIKKKHNNIFNDIKMIKQYSSVVRFAFNRRKDSNDSLKASEIERIVKTTMNNIDSLDASWIKSAVSLAFSLNVEKKLYFGSKFQCKQSKYKKVNKYKESRFIAVDMLGSSSDSKGNRKAMLDIIDNNRIIFKPKKGVKYEINLNLSKNEKELLSLLQNQCENNLNYFNIKIDLENIWITFDEKRIIDINNKEKNIVINKIKDRILGIDLNPNYIALTINDFKDNEHKTLIHKELFCLQRLNLKVNNKNKKDYELVQIAKQIIKLALHYKVETISVENLSISSKNYNKGKNFNRLLNNNWNRNLFVNNLIKRCNLNNIKIRLVRPEYSSFIGQMKFPNEFDSVAASIEVAYRGYLLGKTLNEYNSINALVNTSLLPTQWKNMVIKNDCSYRDLYNLFKEKKLINSYRFLFDYRGYDSESYFRLKSYRSGVDMYKF